MKCNYEWDGKKRVDCPNKAKYFLPVHDSHGDVFLCEKHAGEHLNYCHKMPRCQDRRVLLSRVDEEGQHQFQEYKKGMAKLYRSKEFAAMCEHCDTLEDVLDYVASVLETK